MMSRRPLIPGERRLARIFYVGSGVFLVVGYALYFAARLLLPPAWALQMIEAFKPALGALVTSELVSDSPFPAQVVIVYSAIGLVVLSAWFAYSNLLHKELRAIIRQGLITNHCCPRQPEFEEAPLI